MFSLTRRPRAEETLSQALGVLPVPVSPTLRAALEKLGQRWQCSPEIVAQRILVMALTGWRLKYAELLERLSQFAQGQDDPFRRTCTMLRHHFDAAEVELGEAVKECDRVAWLETLLAALKERRKAGSPARLADLLADGAIGVAGSI